MSNTNWLFTINNPADVDLPRAWPGVRYCCWQLEEGQEGTPHLQGYLILEKRRRLGGMKKIDGTAHWEVRKGTHEQAKNYCQKEETRKEGPWEIGRDLEGRPGKRTDIDEFKESLLSCQTMKDVFERHPTTFMRYYRAAATVRLMYSRPRKFKTEVIVVYGETGVGKSRWANEAYPDAYWKSPNSKWWDNYAQEEIIIVDEFYGWLPYCEMLRLLDRYPCQVETKGGSVNFAPKKIIILSNKAPEDWYDKTKCAWEPLERRIESYGQMMPGGEIMWLKQNQ